MSERKDAATRARVRSTFRGGEAKRAVTATMLGVAFGAVLALFSRKDRT